jgi:hypothetical protein
VRPAEDSPGSDYDSIRERLLERGYLQGRIERFLLRDLLTARTGFPLLLKAALRGASMGGPLLGALLAAAAAAANRPLQGVSDLLLLWLYFTPVAALVLLVLDLVAALFVAAMARRRGPRPGDRLRAAMLVALPMLFYLLAIARVRGAASGLVEEGFFVALALAITLLVGWLAGLVSLVGVITRTGRVPRRQRRPLALLLALLLPVGGILVAAGAVFGTGGDPRAPATFEPREAAPLLLIGVDGLDGSLIQAMEPRGAAADLLALLQEAAVFPLEDGGAGEPAQVWTTLMTGVDAERHGVRGAGAEQLPGVATPLDRAAGPLPLEAALRFLLPARTVPTSGLVRRIRALWEILALERDTVAVGWWASWPAVDPSAPAQLGYVVTDRVLPKLLSGAGADRDTAPESLFVRLEDGFDEDREAIGKEFETAFAAVAGGEVRRLARDSHLIDAYSLLVSRRLLADRSVRAAFVYLPGLEILQHRLGPSPASLVGRLEAQAALEAYVAWVGQALADLRDARDSWQMVLVADPGRRTDPDAEGFVMVRGARAEAGCVGPVIARLDVAPMVLGLSGFPTSREMPGRAPLACLAPAPAPTVVETFGRRGPFPDRGTDPYDPELVERLRSLGYLN